MRGLSRLVWSAALLGLAIGGAGTGPAAASEQEPVRLTAPSSETREYGPLLGADPGNQNGITRDPANCSSATWCDTIPLELSVPNSLKNSETEDYFLRLRVEWDASAGNNLSAYVYDSPFEGAAPIASSATANMPETINLYRPEKPAYILVVHNTNGANAGYTLTAAITVEPFGGAPDFGGVNERPSRPPATSPPPSSSGGQGSDFDNSFTPPPASLDDGFGPPPPLADVDRDGSLSALARSRGGFENSLTAPNLTVQEEEGPPPAPVSGATVALLGGLLPASVVGGGVFWLRRRGGTASPGF